MNNNEKKQHCVGCRDNVYNHGCGDSTECWMLDSMTLVKRKRVPVTQRPPWNQPAEILPDCYRKSGYVFINEKLEI